MSKRQSLKQQSSRKSTTTNELDEALLARISGGGNYAVVTPNGIVQGTGNLTVHSSKSTVFSSKSSAAAKIGTTIFKLAKLPRPK